MSTPNVPRTAREEVSSLYNSVIEDIMRSVKPEFQAEGVDDSVLQKLEALWRRKLQDSGVLAAPATLGLPQQQQTGLEEQIQAAESGAGGAGIAASAHHTNSRPAVVNGAPVSSAAGSKRKFDEVSEQTGASGEASVPGGQAQENKVRDRSADEAPTASTSAGTGVKTGGEQELNSDDDDDDLGLADDDEDDKEPETLNLVLTQFEKVHRMKSKWKCNLKDGILHLNGRDYAFSRANGEFDF
mmetsp:Transcript_22487/g.31280  ORF Transcript_22487/g.31280 Transcript_22487/m.31280 type:complete len:242 (-) Transcript_22487:210-935(-)